MSKERLFLYDTTLRDGQQTMGVQFTVEEKLRICKALDELGIDYIEGGWPGANPIDSSFFQEATTDCARLTAFGMTKRQGRSVQNDDVLAQVFNAGTPAVCLVGKAHDLHVHAALGITLDENLENIKRSMEYGVSLGREMIFDAEHFFDGFRDNPKYTIQTVQTAFEAGARWVVLCDTNGGALPQDVSRAVRAVIEAGVPGRCLGIHTHNDTEHAVANSLCAVDAGVRQIQGTLNGLGERCGNANLISILPTLLLKEPYASQFDLGTDIEALKTLTRTSQLLDDILNRVPLRQSPYVGSSAFAHKAGLHASAILKKPQTYEHIDPEVVGNSRLIPMSNQAGQSNLIARLHGAGIKIEKGDERLPLLLEAIKDAEADGYTYDTAQASFELFARRALGLAPNFFEIKRYRVTVERRKNKHDKMVSVSEAVVVLKIDGVKKLSVSESFDEGGKDRGPVNALAKALSKDMGRYQTLIDDMRLVDFKVRITQAGTAAVTRVIVDSEDSHGRRWSTVGVCANLVDASFEALLDAIEWKILAESK